MPQFITAINMAKPSIPLSEYYEIKQLVSKAPENAIFVIPNTKVRYWFETLTSNVTESPKDVEVGYIPILVLEVGRPAPPIAKLFFLGKFLKAYLLPVKP